MLWAPNGSCIVRPETQSTVDGWDGAIRAFDRQVFLSVLALGLSPDSAREVTQTAWTRLMEKHVVGDLPRLELPGLAIKQAKFLALNQIKQKQTHGRLLAAVPEPSPGPSPDAIAESRQRYASMLRALQTCSPTAKTIFRMVYQEPSHSHSEIAQHVGLSVQRVRQILCETRNTIRQAMKESTHE